MSDHDFASGHDAARVAVTTSAQDSGRWQCKTILRKFHGDSTDPADLYEVIEVDGNMLVTGGVSALLNRLTGGTAAGPFDNSNAALGVGDSSTAEATAQADLQASSNKLRKGMDATYPQHTDTTGTASSKTLTFRATFGPSEANFVWAEWGVFNSVATSGTGLNRMLNRKVQALGTKASGASWQLEVTITIN